MNKELPLTIEQQKHVTRIQDQMVFNIKTSTAAKVKQACDDMTKLNIPRQLICQLICERANDLGLSEDYLRTLVPSEYKNQAQINVAKARIRAGIDNLCQVRKTYQVTKSEDIHFEQENKTKSWKQRFEELKKQNEDLIKSQKPSALKKRVQELENELLHASDIISKYKKHFGDNFESKFRELKTENDFLRKKNERINYIFKMLAVIHDSPDSSDQMVADTVRDFVKRWYEEYGSEFKAEIPPNK